MTWAALRAYNDGGSIGAVESSLLGTLITAPYLRLSSAVEALKREDFSSPHYGAAFAAIMRLPHPEAVLVAHELDASEVAPPAGSYGWGTVVSALLDGALVDGDAVDTAARAVKNAARERAILARRAGKP